MQEHDFNEHGYCKHCGEQQKVLVEPVAIVSWPRGTWFQERRLQLVAEQLKKRRQN